MVRTSIKNSRMNIGLCATRESIKKVCHQLGLQITHQAHAHLRIYNGRSASREVHGSQSERFIHWHHKISSPQDPALLAQRLGESLPQCDSDVFNRMVLVNIK